MEIHLITRRAASSQRAACFGSMCNAVDTAHIKTSTPQVWLVFQSYQREAYRCLRSRDTLF